MDHTVPGVACVVDDDVDLAVAELCGLLDERVEVLVVEHVSGRSDGLATVLVDGVCDALCFVCIAMSATSLLADHSKSYVVTWFVMCSCTELLTAVDIAHNDFGTFIREEPRGLSTNALSRAGHDSRLAIEHAFGVVQVGRDLLSTRVRHD